jgi:hypothetical protein
VHPILEKKQKAFYFSNGHCRQAFMTLSTC